MAEPLRRCPLPERRQLLLAGLAASCTLLGLPAARAQTVQRLSFDEAAQRLRSGGWVLMMRHARTVPGVGDPAGFRLDRCDTQRNLSEDGRAQARRLGEAFRAADLMPAVVRSSAWCRCLETAQLAFGAHMPWSALNSFFEERGEGAQRTAEVLAFVRDFAGPGNAMLVTHQVNVTAATGVFPAQGEVVAMRWQDDRPVPAFSFQPA